MEIQCKKRQLLRFAEVCVAVLILITLTQVCAGFYLVYASHFCMVGCCCLYFKFFSINFKIALEIKSCVFYFFIVKDKLHRIGGTSKFNITREVLKECSMTHSRYAAALAKKKTEEQKKTERREKGH